MIKRISVKVGDGPHHGLTGYGLSAAFLQPEFSSFSLFSLRQEGRGEVGAYIWDPGGPKLLPREKLTFFYFQNSRASQSNRRNSRQLNSD